jgi:hypothetical protein
LERGDGEVHVRATWGLSIGATIALALLTLTLGSPPTRERVKPSLVAGGSLPGDRPLSGGLGQPAAGFQRVRASGSRPAVARRHAGPARRALRRALSRSSPAPQAVRRPGAARLPEPLPHTAQPPARQGTGTGPAPRPPSAPAPAGSPPAAAGDEVKPDDPPVQGDPRDGGEPAGD